MIWKARFQANRRINNINNQTSKDNNNKYFSCHLNKQEPLKSMIKRMKVLIATNLSNNRSNQVIK